MKQSILTLGLIISLVACNDDAVEPKMDSEGFINGLIYFDEESVTREVNKLTTDLNPTTDGHQSNLNILIQRIEQQTESLTITNSCYACIYTSPPISEIIMEVDSLGTQVLRTIDILTPEKENLRFKGVH